MPYLYKKAAKPRVRDTLNRIPPPLPDEGLTGFVHGVKASANEERYARALDRLKKPFQFQYDVRTAFQLPGEDKKIDFLVDDNGTYMPEEIDAAFTHKTAETKAGDRIRDAMVDEILSRYGAAPIKRLDGERCLTQEGADALAQERH